LVHDLTPSRGRMLLVAHIIVLRQPAWRATTEQGYAASDSNAVLCNCELLTAPSVLFTARLPCSCGHPHLQSSLQTGRLILYSIALNMPCTAGWTVRTFRRKVAECCCSYATRVSPARSEQSKRCDRLPCMGRARRPSSPRDDDD
jgi:hypothetical protein